MLQTRFVPVAIDQAYQRRQKDTEGDFYRKIAGQGPRNNFQGTTQGFYIAKPMPAEQFPRWVANYNQTRAEQREKGDPSRAVLAISRNPRRA